MLHLYLVATTMIGLAYLGLSARYRQAGRSSWVALLASGLGMLLIGLLTTRSGAAWPIASGVAIAAVLFYTGGLALRGRRRRA